ncbi:MAG TPA: efflux RND transporter periplasmic adaptor subunit [Methylomirabilota bacterium]|nr:efflux RND transporter periplasmic adaptor subunit [Methylomirabilota bacterium]
MRTRIRNQALFVIALGCLLSAAGCGSRSGESESKMTSYSAGEHPADTAELFSVPQEQMSHVQIATVEKSSLPRVLRLTGAVAYNGFKTTQVFTAVGGPVQEILVAPGEMVRAGQPLLVVSSPDFSVARSAYIKARSTFQLADKNYQRSRDLFEHHAIAERDLQQAESDRAAAQADLQSSEDAMRVLGIQDPEGSVKNPTKLTSRATVIAPVSGEITERLVGPGQLLQANTTQCFTISDMSTVWILVNVYQNDLQYVHMGDDVAITTDAYPDTFHGKISFLSPALDPNTRTLQARIVTPNPGLKLKKDMYVNATVQAGKITDALTVPDAAVLRDTENQPFVYALTRANQFSRQSVTVGDSHNGRTQVTSGLKPGQRIAGDGSLFLQFKNSLQH